MSTPTTNSQDQPFRPMCRGLHPEQISWMFLTKEIESKEGEGIRVSDVSVPSSPAHVECWPWHAEAMNPETLQKAKCRSLLARGLSQA